jgi:hypothetical protein
MPLISSTHDLLAAPPPPSATGQSRYVYLFPALAADDRVGCFAGTTPAETAARLKAFELAARQPLSGMPALQMRLPAAYTYFGQFVNHDISAPVGDVVSAPDPVPSGVIGAVDPPGLDRTRRAAPGVILANLVNEHAHPLTLGSLYGEGPHSGDPAIRALYDEDGKRFRLGMTRREADGVFAASMIDPASVYHDTGARDIPRDGHRPRIADLRNDENVILSQLHLALMLFHNKAVDVLEGEMTDPQDCFRAARQLVTLHYHWLILHDYLPKLLSTRLLGTPLATFPSGLQLPGQVPLEFTTAAFRFGHSMVGQAYDFNDNFGVGGRISTQGATLAQLFEFTSKERMNTDTTETLALPDHWVIDWHRMTRSPARAPTATRPGLGGAEKIDMVFARDMLTIIGDANVPLHGSILFRNLMRGHHRRIAFGQTLAEACRQKALDRDEIRDALPPGLRGPAEDLGFLTETPAWLYFLCEARVREAGERIGPTASHIIAETIVGLMRQTTWSVLHYQGGTWHPHKSQLRGAGEDSLTTLRKFLCFAVKDTAVPVLS